MAAGFGDAQDGQWYSRAVGYLSAAGIISGYEDGEFKGDAPITRAEFVTVASKFGNAEASEINPYNDISPDHWAYDYIMTAYMNGWVSGYPDGSFGPDDNITRAEAFAIINRMLGWSADAAQAYDEALASESPFTDLRPDEWFFYDVLLAYIGKR